MSIVFQPIGTIHTPFTFLHTPEQPDPEAAGEFWITVDREYAAGLERLSSYRYIYVLYHLDQVKDPVEMIVTPPWAPDQTTGVFASRSPNRPNAIGMSIVQVKEVVDNEITISGIDVYNGTPLLDIKPYLQVLDAKDDANNGWLDDLPDRDHRLAHLLGRPHEHQHGEHAHGEAAYAGHHHHHHYEHHSNSVQENHSQSAQEHHSHDHGHDGPHAGQHAHRCLHRHHDHVHHSENHQGTAPNRTKSGTGVTGSKADD